MDYIRRQYGRKRILIFTLVLICMFSLVLGISLHGVSSYLAAASPAVTNEFSANLDIDIAESDSGDGDDNEYTNTYEMVPGEDIEDKDPVVTIPKDTIDCWVYITIEKSDNFDEYLKYELAEGWTALGDDYPGTYYRMVETDKDKDQSFAVLKENKVKLQDGVDDDMINAIENPPQLMITAYAVQKASFEGKPLEAWENTFGK